MYFIAFVRGKCKFFLLIFERCLYLISHSPHENIIEPCLQVTILSLLQVYAARYSLMPATTAHSFFRTFCHSGEAPKPGTGDEYKISGL